MESNHLPRVSQTEAHLGAGVDLPVQVQPLLLTPRQAAQMLNISPRSLWTLTKSGEVPCIRLGRRAVRYDPRDLLAFIEQRKDTRA